MTDTSSEEPSAGGTHRAWLGREELVYRLRRFQADSGLRVDLERLGCDTTDELGPIR